mmetsp:Transcript_36598/g.79886  ORF Transcript_36598/g.79886 Transcript_36598/m.79886 type:complete len:369 (-) Transcript_36598:272-1378(-)
MHPIVPLVVFLHVVEDLWRQGVPNALVGQDRRLHEHLDIDITRLDGRHVLAGDPKQHGLEVLRCAAQPVLQREDESARILGLVAWQELQDLGECPDKLQQAVLEGATGGWLPLLKRALAQVLHLLCEGAERATGDLSQVEGPELVQLHDLRHGGEAEASIEGVTARAHDLDQLLGQLLHEDEGADEDVRILEVPPEILLDVGVADLLEEVAHTLRTDAAVALVDLAHCGCHRGLVLRFEHDVHNLHALLAGTLLLRGHHAACGHLGIGVAPATASAHGAGSSHAHHHLVVVLLRTGFRRLHVHGGDPPGHSTQLTRGSPETSCRGEAEQGPAERQQRQQRATLRFGSGALGDHCRARGCHHRTAQRGS